MASWSLADVVDELEEQRPQSLSLTDLVAEKQRKPPKFPWESDDGMYVMGPIGDKILKQLRAKRAGGSWAGSKEQPSFSSSWPASPSSPSSAARRKKCKAPNSRCMRFDPVIWVPTSLASDLEITKDVKVTARKLLNEAGPEVVPGVSSNDLYFWIDEPTPNGAPLFSQPGKRGHICAFRLRTDLVDKELAGAGQQGRKVVSSRLDRLQYACNMRLLPELSAWFDQYRSVKVSIVAEKASVDAELKAMARHRKMEALGPREGEVLLSQPEAEAMAAQEAEQAAKALENQVEGVSEVCKCGFHEVWHESALDLADFDAGVQVHDRRRSTSQALKEFGEDFEEDETQKPDISAEEEERLKAQALRAVVQDDCVALEAVLKIVRRKVWSVWVNKARKNLLTLAQERGATSTYSLLAKYLGMAKEVKREAVEERQDTTGPLKPPSAPASLTKTLGKSFSAGSLLATASRQTLGKHSTAMLTRGNLVFKKVGASLVSPSR